MGDTQTDPSTDAAAATVAGDASTATSAPIAVATRFEQRFQIHAELARGGMGRVAVATDTTLRREVAIKELLETRDPGLIQRFEREALITARLQHPGVVGVYDFARHDDGVAALVMRRVRGRPFSEVLRDAKTLAQRLELLAPFISACDAVAYAHREGVIHRDLKPANVLLGDFGDTVVIDWGLAKDLRDHTTEPGDAQRSDATSSLGAALPELTLVGSVMGTPAYMAPEQARGEPADARSDVYALGSMLYELLGGAPPYEGKDSRAVLEALLRGAPQPLPARQPELQPELATIVERAMARESAGRYADAGALAAELKRFQTGQLVSAHRYTTGELLRRWARRHAAALTTSAVALLVLAALGAVAVHRVLVERDRATQAAEASERIAHFMTGIFKAARPGESRNTITVRSMLDRAADNIEHDLSEDELARARLMIAMGEAYANLGIAEPARRLIGQSLAIRTHVLGPDAVDTLKARNELASALVLTAPAEAEKLARETLAVAERRLPAGDEVTCRAWLQLSYALAQEGRYAESEQAARSALALQVQRMGAAPDRTTSALNAVATALARQRKYAEAKELLQRLVAIESASPNFKAHDLIAAKVNLAATEFYLHDYEGAEKLQVETLASLERLRGPTHPETLEARANLANTYAAQKQYGKAEATLLKVLDLQRKTNGPKYLRTLEALYNLSCTLALAGQRERALGYLTELVDLGVPNEIDVEHDDDLRSLRGDPAFEALLARIRAQRK